MSIPKYEMDNLVQGEFFIFEDDETCVGLVGQTINENFLEKKFRLIDREIDRREAATRILTFDDKLTPYVGNDVDVRMWKQGLLRGKRLRPSTLVWTDEVAQEPFAEVSDKPRIPVSPDEARQYGIDLPLKA